MNSMAFLLIHCHCFVWVWFCLTCLYGFQSFCFGVLVCVHVYVHVRVHVYVEGGGVFSRFSFCLVICDFILELNVGGGGEKLGEEKYDQSI